VPVVVVGVGDDLSGSSVADPEFGNQRIALVGFGESVAETAGEADHDSTGRGEH